MSEQAEETTIYKVVLNNEEQYSIWPENRPNPAGWFDAGKVGTKTECLSHINNVWTDMRPLSLRKYMEELSKKAASGELNQTFESPASDGPDDLIERLSVPGQPVEASLRPEKSTKALLERIEKNYVHIKFTGTRGGTELGVPLDKNALAMAEADFEKASGTVHLEGNLKLNYRSVRCVADIDVGTLSGVGHLIPQE